MISPIDTRDTRQTYTAGEQPSNGHHGYGLVGIAYVTATHDPSFNGTSTEPHKLIEDISPRQSLEASVSQLTALTVATHSQDQIDSSGVPRRRVVSELCRTPRFFDEDISKAVLDFHETAIDTYHDMVQFPYTEYAQEYENGIGDTENLLVHRELDGCQLIASRAKFLDKSLLAQIIHTTTTTYVEAGTMGSQFPHGDTLQEAQLAALFCDFHPDDILIFLRSQSQDGRLSQISGCVKITKGRSERSIEQVQHGAPSTLPTLQSLRLRDNGALYRGATMIHFSRHSESDLVCGSRFFVINDRYRRTFSQMTNTSESSLIGEAPLSVLLIDLIPHVYSLDKPGQFKALLCDTHKPGVSGTLLQLGGEVIAYDGEVVPTSAVQNSVLHHHYSDKENGGHADDIKVVLISTEDYCKNTRPTLERLNQHLIKQGLDPIVLH